MTDASQHILGYLCRQMLFWIEQHAGADAVFAVGAMEHVDVDATLAALPESLVIGQFGKRDRLITQFGVHLHHGSTAGQRENLGMRPSDASQRERHVLDALGQSLFVCLNWPLQCLVTKRFYLQLCRT